MADQPLTPARESCEGDGVDYSSYFNSNLLFESYKEACQWCKKVAVSLNFEVFNSSHKFLGDGRRKVFVRCNRGGDYKAKKRDESRKNTQTKSTGCEFMVKVLENVDRLFYVHATSQYGFHNHKLIVYGEGQRQIGQLTPPMKEKIHEMASIHTKPAKMLNALIQQFPDGPVPNKRQIYNEVHAQKKRDAELRNPIQQFAHLAREWKYEVVIESDIQSGKMVYAFAAHKTSMQLLSTYPHVICMDCTYKTNRYKFPLFEMVGVTPTNHNFLIGWALLWNETERSYFWVLQILKNLLGDACPNAILTDRELGLLNPVGRLFPNTAHLLCTWHIKKDVLAKSYKLFGARRTDAKRFVYGFWVPIMTASSIDEFHAKVQVMHDTYSHKPEVLQYVERTWLVHKEKFVLCWTNNVMHFGNTTTNRVESQHASTKYFLETSTCSIDTLFSRNHGAITVQLNKSYTPLCLYILQLSPPLDPQPPLGQ